MKVKKLIALLTISVLLVGCGNATEPDVEAGAVETGADTQEAGQEAVEKDNSGTAASEEAKSSDNQIAIFANKEDKGVKSALITFDAEKVGIADVSRNATSATYFDCHDNSGSTLAVICYDRPMEELYNETVERFSDNMREKITLTDITEVTIGEFTFQRYDVLYEGELRDQHYMLKLDNGYILHNGNGYGYDYNPNMDIEEMLTYVFVDVESGDGSEIRPSFGFEKNNDGSAVTYNFNSGETFVLDYPEDKVEISATGFVINVTYLDEGMEESVDLEMHMSRKYDSLEPYIAAEEAKGYIDEGLEIKHADVNGLDLTYVCEEPGGSNSVYGLYYIDLPGDFSIRGNYRNFYEDLAVSLPDAVGRVLGAQVDVQAATEVTEEGDVSAETLAALIDVYGYKEPVGLGATWDSITYSLDSTIYQFPTPVAVFLQHGWKIPEVYKEQYSEIGCDESVSIALENEDGSVLYNVVVMNKTGASVVTLEECMVMMMMVTQDSNVEFELPEGISFETTLDELKASNTDCVENGSYSVFSWGNDESYVTAWYHPEIGIEYFEFIGP